MVSHAPNGARPISLTPRGARPLSRTMLVLAAVSSINTSRAGVSMPCLRIQRRRARATSARCRSAACRLFFESDAVSIEKPPERTAAGSNPLLAQFRNGFDQGQVGLSRNHSQYPRFVLFQWRSAASARLRCGASALPPALQPFHRRTHTHLKPFGRLAPRRPELYGFDNAFPQVTRVRFRHRSPRQRESMPKDSLIHSRPGILQIQIHREPL